MDKYVQRVMEEVYHTFSNHYTEQDEMKEFLIELIKELRYELAACEFSKCGTCTEGECDCEPETSFFNFKD